LTAPSTTPDRSADALPASWQRLLALSGVVLQCSLLSGGSASGGDAPDYAAADQAWTEWADDNEWKSRIGAFAMLLAGFVFLHFVGKIRSVLGTAETTVRGSAQLARVAFAGALIGIAGMTTAIVMIAAASSEGTDANPVVSRAVTTASAGPFLVAAMGFAALLMAAGDELAGRNRHRAVPSDARSDRADHERQDVRKEAEAKHAVFACSRDQREERDQE
jgi:hypothetical protein